MVNVPSVMLPSPTNSDKGEDIGYYRLVEHLHTLKPPQEEQLALFFSAEGLRAGASVPELPV